MHGKRAGLCDMALRGCERIGIARAAHHQPRTQRRDACLFGRAADLGEKMALFEAFGGMCGDAGVGELDGILNARGLLGAKETPEMRACAARALGLVGTRAAVGSLQKAADTKDVVVRSAVARAMRGGT
jgi:hypothetical protein